VGVLVTLNWRLALTALAIIPGVMLMSLVFAKRVRPICRSVRTDVERIDGRVGETFAAIRVVRAFGRKLRELADYLIGRHTVARKELFAQRREMLLWTSWSLLLGGANVVIVWHGGYLNIAGRATIGDIMAFQWCTFLLLNPVWQLVNSFSELQRSLATMERVFDVLAMEADKPDSPHASEAPAVVTDIAFEQVDFEYREGRPVVRDFTVAVTGGSVVALVGRSGAGKTTVTDLVARFHDPTRGRIFVNGTEIRDYRLRSYRELLAIVQQDVILFDGSVRENIAYGRRQATADDVESAARLANAHEFIERLPEQYDTMIGERGVRLSGGQQQRLAIARAILAAPQMLILDEAASNLDTGSETRRSCAERASRAIRPSGIPGRAALGVGRGMPGQIFGDLDVRDGPPPPTLAGFMAGVEQRDFQAGDGGSGAREAPMPLQGVGSRPQVGAQPRLTTQRGCSGRRLGRAPLEGVDQRDGCAHRRLDNA
jgi:ATP-binding cassette subfamily B protein/subfamily B ATP-binding cassette protein MsbA